MRLVGYISSFICDRTNSHTIYSNYENGKDMLIVNDAVSAMHIILQIILLDSSSEGLLPIKCDFLK